MLYVYIYITLITSQRTSWANHIEKHIGSTLPITNIALENNGCDATFFLGLCLFSGSSCQFLGKVNKTTGKPVCNWKLCVFVPHGVSFERLTPFQVHLLRKKTLKQEVPRKINHILGPFQDLLGKESRDVFKDTLASHSHKNPMSLRIQTLP